MYPTYPRLLKDRDQVNDWYLDQDCTIVLHNGHTVLLKKGFKFDSHSVPWWARPIFPRYIPTTDNRENDVYAAMVHDALVACEHWLPYERSFVDYEYKRFMNMLEYKMCKRRSYWMPLAVSVFGSIKYGWRPYRGEVPKKMHITVAITVDMV